MGIPKTTAPKSLMQNLGMKSVVAKFVPWLLPQQKVHCAAVANDAGRELREVQRCLV